VYTMVHAAYSIYISIHAEMDWGEVGAEG
jgi:hypothetical protein